VNRRYIILIIILALMASGCANGENAVEPDADLFKLEVKLPETMQANLPFAIESMLWNESERTLELGYGADLFTYVVRNEQGESVGQPETRVVISIGYGTLLGPGKEIASNSAGHSNLSANEFTLPAGTYTVTVQAGFSVVEAGESRTASLATEPLSFVVK
jgi:hypothetical protein